MTLRQSIIIFFTLIFSWTYAAADAPKKALIVVPDFYIINPNGDMPQIAEKKPEEVASELRRLLIEDIKSRIGKSSVEVYSGPILSYEERGKLNKTQAEIWSSEKRPVFLLQGAMRYSYIDFELNIYNGDQSPQLVPVREVKITTSKHLLSMNVPIPEVVGLDFGYFNAERFYNPSKFEKNTPHHYNLKSESVSDNKENFYADYVVGVALLAAGPEGRARVPAFMEKIYNYPTTNRSNAKNYAKLIGAILKEERGEVSLENFQGLREQIIGGNEMIEWAEIVALAARVESARKDGNKDLEIWYLNRIKEKSTWGFSQDQEELINLLLDGEGDLPNQSRSQLPK